ncbi:MAG: hypothetical protein HY833_00690 [Candidatus Aenigmarchaeota archaeon]|nr:hypothetical protein [Candidatus Aenigmarchaeota archaeon]
MEILPRKSYGRKQILVDEIICALGDYYSAAAGVLPPAKLGQVKEYSDFNIGIMESLRGSMLLYVKSEKNLASYLDTVKGVTRALVSTAPKKL